MSTVIDHHDFAMAAAELGRREGEGLCLYRPRAEQLPFHLSMASERLVRGGSRSGKTVAAACEVASAATGIPLIRGDGMELPHKYPTNRPLVIWVIGFDLKHIARMHGKLFRPGLFKIIEDEDTGEVRAWKPWNQRDLEREDDTKPSPPLIPERMVKDWGWESRAERIFNVCRLKNGTEIFAFPSGGEVGVGDAVDLIWIDEAIQIESHVEEWQARLSDVRGRIVWSSWPKLSNDALVKMSRRAEQEMAESDEPDVFEIKLRFSDNPFIPKEEKAKRLKAWAAAGDAVIQARDLGEFVTDSFLVFPTFNIDVHGLPVRGEPDAFETVLAATGFKPPTDWTHYLALDPGHTCEAAILAAVPPPEVGDYLYVYDEIYLKSLEAEDLAAAIVRRWPHITWEMFVIDDRAGRQTPMGFGKTVGQQYVDAFSQHGLRCRRTGSHFLPGSDNVAARNGLVRQWLARREDGTTKFRCLTPATLNMQQEFGLYKKKVTRDDIHDDVVRRHDHLMGCLGYLASRGPVFVPPAGDEEPRDPIDRFLKTLRRPRESLDDSFYMDAGTRPQPMVA